MADLNEQSNWESGIYRLEETDVVRGGDPENGGVSNVQGKQLGNRTRFLHDRLGRMEDVVEIASGSGAEINWTSHKNKHCALLPNIETGEVVIDTGSYPDGGIVSISVNDSSTTSTIPDGRVKITSAAGSYIRSIAKTGASGVIGDNHLYLYIGENVRFVKKGGCLYITGINAQTDAVGEIVHKARAPRFALEAKGQLVERAAFPRLWDWVKGGGEVGPESSGIYVPDTQWLLAFGTLKGLFSSGNGSTNFRLPDLRGMFLRGLDNGRGLDLDRWSENEGSFEPDSIKEHLHSMYAKELRPHFEPSLEGVIVQDPPKVPVVSGDSPLVEQNQQSTGQTGTYETRPKNIGFTAYIKY